VSRSPAAARGTEAAEHVRSGRSADDAPFDVSRLRHRDNPIDGPNIDEDNPAEVEYTITRVKHHVPCGLPRVHFQFATDEDVASFAINYRLVAANIREPREGMLNVRITVHERSPARNPAKVFNQAVKGEE
jgi:hypothetical protein